MKIVDFIEIAKLLISILPVIIINDSHQDQHIWSTTVSPSHVRSISKVRDALNIEAFYFIFTQNSEL